MQILVVAPGYRAPGYRCTGCGYIIDQRLDECPFCGDGVEEIGNAVGEAVSQVLEKGGRVDIVRDHQGLAQVGIGALSPSSGKTRMAAFDFFEILWPD